MWGARLRIRTHDGSSYDTSNISNWLYAGFSGVLHYTLDVPTGWCADQIWLEIRPISTGGTGHVVWEWAQLERRAHPTSFTVGTRANPPQADHPAGAVAG